MKFSTGTLGAARKGCNSAAVQEVNSSRGMFVFRAALVAFLVVLCGAFSGTANAQTFGCTPPMANDIVCENSKLGNPSTEWDVSSGDAGDPTIQGFATDISVPQGGTITFKINTPARAYTITIYRIGYYQGNGARKIVSITPSASLPQTQPTCKTDSTTTLVDCGNWAVSASWAVPSNATSGVYVAHLVRTDTGGDSHIVFVVRNDSSHSAVLYQTADESWQAYNTYGPGGFSLYGDNNGFDLPNRAFKVSYNRPFLTRGFEAEAATWVFGAEFAMIQWVEQNGFDVTYTTGLDGARNSGTLMQNHKIYLTAGHDEYWSGPQRANLKAARDAGVNLAFFSGNEMFWKVRWENSIDGSNTPYRTMVCYKETLAFAKIDPDDPPTWTGTWRDPSFSPPADGGLPENNMTGTLFMVNGPGADNPGYLAVQVPAADGKMRFWRNTAVAALSPGSTYKLPDDTLGYEWDSDIDNGFRPAGAFQLSTTNAALTADLLLDYGGTYGAGNATHHMMMYRAPSGALVFGAGTVDLAWALNNNHDDPFDNPQNVDPNLQQAVINLFADMGVQPATLQSGLAASSASTDHTPPTSTISSPAPGATLQVGTSVTVTGAATDAGGGVVGGVEVSLDGGNTWHPAVGRASWSYTGSPTVVGGTTIKSRAVDDSGNIETPSSGVSVTIGAHDCPCDTWSSSTVPQVPDSGDGSSIEVGVKFTADFNGYITGIRFYKSSANTGTHVGNLWTPTGSLLASAIFSGESASGWQQVNFSSPVAITANTVYVASYFAPSGHYAASDEYFSASGQDNPPIHLLANSVSPNGVFTYGSVSTFPSSNFNATNYWVDVVFMPAQSMPGAPPALLLTPTTLSFLSQVGANPASQSVSLFNEGSGTVTWTASANVPWLSLSATSGSLPYTMNVSVNSANLAAGSYTGTITINATGNIPTQTITVNLAVTNVLLSTNIAMQGLQGWVTSPLGLGSDWSVAQVSSKSAIQFSGGGNSQIFAGNSAWTNYTLTVPVQLSSSSNYPGGIRGRVNPSTGAGYMLWLYPATNQLILYRASAWDINQSLVELAAAPAALGTGSFHKVTMVFNGSQIQVAYDGSTVMNVTDATYASGLVALEGLNQVISFGDVLVTAPAANTGSISSLSSSLSFSANYAGPNPPSQSVQVTAGGGGILPWTAVSNASWLSVSPSSGVSPATLQVSVNSSTLGGGTFTGAITLNALGANNSPQSINVTLNVIVPPPTIAASPTALSFNAVSGQAAPPSQAVTLTNAGFGSFSYTVTSNSSWLSATPSSGSVPGIANVSVNQSGLAVGTYTGNVIVSATGIANSPFSVPVTLQVYSPDMTESFTDAGTGWIVSPMGNGAGWSASNGVYSYNGAGLSLVCSGNSGWTNYTFDTNVKLSNLSNWPGGVRARVNPATGSGYAVWLYPGSGQMILYKIGAWNINDSSLTQIGHAVMSFDSTNFHDLGMSFQGNQISVYWDGKLMISTTDTSYSSGYVCLDADSQPISYSNVRVNAVQGQVTLATPPSSLVFSALPGTIAPSQTINVSAGGASTAWAASVSSGASWLTLSASTTLTPGVLTVSANPTGMAEGTYNATITLSAPGATNSPIAIPVTLAVKTAVLSVTPPNLYFFGTASLNPVPEALQVANLGTGNLGWTASATSSWIGLSSTSGAAPSTVTVSPNTSTLANGTYNDTITIASPDVNNSPANISVTTQVGTLLFSDNFSAGAGNWTVGPLGFASGWSVINGTYTYNGEGHTQSYAGSTTWTDYTVSTNFQLSSTSDYPGGLRGRVNTASGACYGAWLYPAEGIIRLFRIGQWNIDANNTLLAGIGGLVIDTKVHNLRLSFQGSTIKVFYDNALVITATDASYTQGAIALDVSNQPIAFSNVSVISLP